MKRRARLGCSIAIAGLVIVAGACLVSMYMQSPQWRVSRTRTIAATSPRVQGELIDLRRYIACCGTPEAQSGTADLHFSPSTEGEGAWATWTAPGGVERITIDGTSADRVLMHYDIADKRSQQTIHWRSVSERTEVTWTIEGDKSGLLQRFIWPLARVEPNVSEAIDAALIGLERAAQ